MGGGVSLNSDIEEELRKPRDGSDIRDHESGKMEVIRLRNIIYEYTSASTLASGNVSAESGIESEIDSEKQFHKDFHKILGVDDEQMKRNPAMKKMGVLDESYDTANEIIAHSGIGVAPADQHLHKQEFVAGYREDQIKREKAVKKLGVSESFMEDQRAQMLGAVGIGE